MCFLLHQHWDLNSGTQTYTGSTLSHFSSPGHFNFLSVLACLLACFSAEGCGRGIPHPASQEALRNHVREFASWLLSGIHQDLATSSFHIGGDYVLICTDHRLLGRILLHSLGRGSHRQSCFNQTGHNLMSALGNLPGRWNYKKFKFLFLFLL